jgi:uncharacterized protein (TIGR02391 family)
VADLSAKAVLDAVRRMALDLERSTAIIPYPPKLDDVALLYDAMITAPDLRSLTRKLFRDGHYSLAVEQACKLVNNQVKDLCGQTAKDGPDLMHHAFKAEAPALRINPNKTVSERDEQDGYRYIFAGLMTGVRNPRAHEHLLRDEPEAALEILVMANHLLGVLARAKRTRNRTRMKAAAPQP